MKLSQILQEEWKDSVQHRGKTYEIFINPSQKEINELSKEHTGLRYIIDGSRKKVYVFGSNLLHMDVTKQLGIVYKPEQGVRVFGVVEQHKVGNKLEIDEYDALWFNRFLKRYEGRNHDWIWRYFEKPEWLKEEWADSFKYGKHTVEVFSNPTKDELRKLANKNPGSTRNSLRFIATNSPKKLYVWPATVLHNIVYKELNLGGYHNLNTVAGVILKEGDKWEMSSSFGFDLLSIKDQSVIRKKNWKWTEKTFSGLGEYLNTFNEEWEDSFKYNINGPDRTIEIFKNPTPKEMNEVGQIYRGKKYLRFIAHKENVYVFQPTVYHIDASKTLNHSGSNRGYWGSAVKTNKGWKFEGTDTSSSPPPSFVDKYIKIDNKPGSPSNSSVGPLKIHMEKVEARGKKLKKIFYKEEWADSFKLSGKTYEIMKNPSVKEMLEVASEKNKEIRWLADNKTKTFYAWNINTLIHGNAGRKLGLFNKSEDYLPKQKRFVGGTANFNNGRFVTDSSHIVESDILDLYEKHNYTEKDINNWKWFEKYVDIEVLKKMIRKRLKKDMNEEWEDSIKVGDKTIEVFKNPTQAEIMKMKGEIRWLADRKKKEVYVWNGIIGPLHYNMARRMGYIKTVEEFLKQDKFIGGTARKRSGKYVSDSAHTLDRNLNLLQYDWDWINQYLDAGPSIRKAKKELKRINNTNKSRKEDGLKPMSLFREEWKDSFKTWSRGPMAKHNTVEIFVDPTTKEMLEVEKHLSLRFIADYRTKKVYVFSPNSLHWEVAEKLGLASGMEDYFQDTKLLGGVGMLKNGKFRLERLPHNVRSIAAGTKELQELVTKAKRDWSFVDKYIAGTTTLLKEKAAAYKKRLKIKKARNYVREQYEL